MKRHAGLLLAGLALAVLAAILLPARVQHAPIRAPRQSERASAPSPAARLAGSVGEHTPVPGAIARPEIGFSSQERLVEHFRKHGREFGATDEAAYLRLAQALRDRPARGEVIEAVRADGVITRFDRGSGAFVAFGRDCVIRTCFKPNDGEAYFRRQLGRGRSGR